MEGNDISPHTTIGQASMFEGVLASPPSTGVFKGTQYKRLVARDDWKGALQLWTPHLLPLKSLADCVNRLGIRTEVYTFLPVDAVDAIESWLSRKGISVPVYSFPDRETLREDFSLNRGLVVLYTDSREDALLYGPRATVVSPDTIWST